MNLTQRQRNLIRSLDGQIYDNCIEFSFYENVSNDGESITLQEAIEIEDQMIDVGFDGGLIGSSIDESDMNVLRFEI